MTKKETTTLLVYKMDKNLFNKLHNKYNELLRKENDIPLNLFREETKADFFTVLLEEYVKSKGLM